MLLGKKVQYTTVMYELELWKQDSETFDWSYFLYKKINCDICRYMLMN